MLCPNCGYNNQANNRFCVRCGIDISAAPPSETPSFETGRPPGSQAPPPPGPQAPPAASPAPPSPWGLPHQSPPQYQPGPPAPPNAAPPSAYGSPPDAGAPPNPFAPPGAYPPPPGSAPYAPYPYAPSGFHAQATNGLAVASFVLGMVGWVACGIGSIVAIVLGFVARSQIRESQGRQGGDGLALAGIVLGFLAIGLIVLFVILGVATGSNSGSS